MNAHKKPYFENLDALRFAAAFAVFVFHVSRDLFDFFAKHEVFDKFEWIIKITDKGALGVNFFFVLSGFLITYLMFWELQAKGSFSYPRFLLRRTLRIWPLYFLIIGIGFVLLPYLITDYETTHRASNYILFLANFDEIKYGAFDSINFLTSPWSIAVEEQFYVVWGLLGLILLGTNRTKKQILKFFIYGLLVISIFIRLYNFEDSRVLYYHTLSVMPDLLIGCLLAILWYENQALFAKLKSIKFWQILLIYLVGFTLILLKNLIFKDVLVVAERYFIALFFAFIITDQVVNRRKIPILMLHNSALRLGKISYGLYMFHLLVMYLLNKFWLSELNLDNATPLHFMLYAGVYVVASWSIVVLISKLSFAYFESPFLKLKEKFGG